MAITRTAPIDTTPVDLQTARAIEAAEARAWIDLYDAAPADFAETAAVGHTEIAGAVVLRWAATGRRYFSRTVGLGVLEPAMPEALDAVLDHYERAGIDMFLLQSLPHCRPAEYEQWLVERGLTAFDQQDRVVRGGEPASALPSGELVEQVNRESSDEWSEFLQRIYGLDTGP